MILSDFPLAPLIVPHIDAASRPAFVSCIRFYTRLHPLSKVGLGFCTVHGPFAFKPQRLLSVQPLRSPRGSDAPGRGVVSWYFRSLRCTRRSPSSLSDGSATNDGGQCPLQRRDEAVRLHKIRSRGCAFGARALSGAQAFLLRPPHANNPTSRMRRAARFLTQKAPSILSSKWNCGTVVGVVEAEDPERGTWPQRAWTTFARSTSTSVHTRPVDPKRPGGPFLIRSDNIITLGARS